MALSVSRVPLWIRLKKLTVLFLLGIIEAFCSCEVVCALFQAQDSRLDSSKSKDRMLNRMVELLAIG
jgi:hypothetical protein